MLALVALAVYGRRAGTGNTLSAANPLDAACKSEDQMIGSRRRLLLSLAAGASACLVGSKILSGQIPLPSKPKPHPSPDDPEAKAGPTPSKSTTKALLEQNQKNLKKDIEKLYDLVGQLKDEIGKTDAVTVLSLSMIKKADEIEKLAKQIKDRARG